MSLLCLWMAALLVPCVSSSPLLESDDARVGNLLEGGIVEGDLLLSAGDPLFGWDSSPRIEVDLQPPEGGFGGTTRTRSSLDDTRRSTGLQLLTKPLRTDVRKDAAAGGPSTGALPPAQRLSPEPRLQSPVVKVPLKLFQARKVKPFGHVVKTPADGYWKNRKIQRPSQHLQPPTKGFEVKAQEEQRMLEPPPSRHLLPPTREFFGTPTIKALLPARELTPPRQEFPSLLPRRILPPNREFSPLSRRLTPPVHEFAIVTSATQN